MPQVAVALLKIGFFVFEAFAGAAAAATLGAGAAVAIGAAVVVGGTLIAKQAMSLFEVEMPTVDTDASRQRTVRSTTEPQKIIYGEALVSGPISFIGLSGTDNSDLYQTIVLAGHELNDITDIHMDDIVIANADINGGSAAGGAVGSGSIEFGPKNGTICVINKHLGETSQTADVLLTVPFTNYTSAHRGDGIAYLAMKWVLNEDSAETWDKFAPSNVKALVKGKSVFDPRTNTTVYSDNPALCLADYLTDTILGMGIPTSKIDWDAVEIAADGCDVSVAVPGGTEKRFTCNGVVFATDSHQKNINKILSSMNGNLVYSNGKYIVHAGIYEDETIQEPFETLNEDDLIGAISIKTSLERSDRFNTIKGLFVDPAQNHKSTEFPKVQLADAVTRDNDEILEKEVQYPMTNSSYMAQRLSHKLIKLSDQQKVISFPANLSALRITAGDRVKVSIEELSWSNKVFQCVGWTFSEEGGVNLTLREDSESAYADPTVTPDNEYSTITATGDITDAFRGVPSPSGLTVTPGLKSNELNWVNPGKTNDFGTIYVYASRNANFSSAIKIGETDGTQFIHDGSNKSLIFSPPVVNVGDTYTIRTLGNTNFVAMGAASNTVGVVFTATATGSGTGNLWETLSPGDLRYYWVRAVKNVGTDDASRSGLEPPNDPNTTVFATVGAVEVDWVNVADPTIGIDINNDTISINTGVANTTTGQTVATSGLEAGTTVTQGGITMNQGGSIKGGQSAYNSGTGFFLGYDTNKYKFSIGNAGNNSLAFDGTNLAVTGAITATSGTFTGTVNASAGVFTGSVSIGSTGAIYGGTMNEFLKANTSGFFLGYDTNAYKLSVGNSSGEVLTWDGSKLNVEANTVSFSTGGEQDYSSESRYTTSQKSATVVLANNSDYFLFDNRRQDLAFPDFIVSYYLGPLTSGTQSSAANAINGIMENIEVELFYTDASTGSPGTWTSLVSVDATSWDVASGPPFPGYVYSNFRVKESGTYVASLDTRNGILDDYPTISPFGDALDGTSVPVGLVDNDYFINIPLSKNTFVFPKGRYFIKVVITVTDGSLSPYPATGSPTATERRISIPNASSFVHPDFGQSVFVGGAHTTIFTDNNRDNETLIKGGSVYLMSKEGANAADQDSTAIFFGGRGTTGGTPNAAYGPLHGLYFFNDRDSIGSGSGILGSIGSPQFSMYVPYDGSKLTFGGDVNFTDGLYINGVAVNAGAVTGPAGSNTQVQFNNSGALGASSDFTFNDSTDTLTVKNLTVSGTTTTVNTDNLTVKDPNITLNYSTGDSSSTANNSGITIQDAVNSTTDASLLWKTASDTFEFSHGANIPKTYVNATSEDAVSGVWNNGSSSGNWGTIKFGAGYAWTDTVGGYKQFNIPTGADTCYMSQLKWSSGGYVDVHAVQADGDLVFLGRIGTGQSVENNNHLNTAEHDAQAIDKIGSGLDAFSAIRITNKRGRFHFTGLAFSTQQLDNFNGGMIAAEMLHSGVLSNVTNTNWDAAYTYSQVGHLPLAGGTLTGTLAMGANAITSTGTISSGAITSSGTSNFGNFQLTDASKLGFGTVKSGASVNHTASVDEGIFWHTGNEYGIYRTAGAWASPYPVLKIRFDTGVDINGGAAGAYGDINFSSSNLKMGGTQFLDQSRNLTAVQGNFSGTLQVGGGATQNPYNATASTRLLFGGGDSNALENYYIGTNTEDFGGSYTKLDLRWHTGIRMGAQGVYGGVRFYSNEDLTAKLMSIGEGDGNTDVKVYNNLHLSAATTTASGITGARVIDIYGSSSQHGSVIAEGNVGASFVAMNSGLSATNLPSLYFSNGLRFATATNKTAAGFDEKLRINADGVSPTFLIRAASNMGHLVGSYNNVGSNGTHSNPIYTIGSAYNPSLTTLGNMYGVGYTNVAASFIDFTGGTSWGMYVAADGDARIWLDGSSGNISSKGSIYAASHVYAAANLYLGNGSNGRFYNDSATRTAFADGSFYIQGNVPNYYNYATLQYHGSTSGTSHFFRGNALSGNSWSIGTTGVAAFTNGSYSGTLTTGGDIQVNGNQVRTAAVGARVKFAVWSNDVYGIGMEPGYTFGPIGNEYVMSFQMNDANTRGFWWGDQGHTSAQGAMALSTDGYLTVAAGMRIGYGESDTTKPSAGLQVNAAIAANGGLTQDNHTLINGTDTWYRTSGNEGIYFSSHSGGVHMTDTTWVRTYNSKKLYVGGGSAEIATSGNVTAYYSDMRLKTKTADIDNALEKVNSLSGFKYVENDLAKELGYSNDKQQVGLSAQQIQAVLPEAVSLAPIDMDTDEHTGEITSKSGENYLTVDYAKLVPLLVEAIKELTQEVESLKTKLKEK